MILSWVATLKIIQKNQIQKIIGPCGLKLKEKEQELWKKN